jgi:hypothetical protein
MGSIHLSFSRRCEKLGTEPFFLLFLEGFNIFFFEVGKDLISIGTNLLSTFWRLYDMLDLLS